MYIGYIVIVLVRWMMCTGLALLTRCTLHTNQIAVDGSTFSPEHTNIETDMTGRINKSIYKCMSMEYIMYNP